MIRVLLIIKKSDNTILNKNIEIFIIYIKFYLKIILIYLI